MRRGWSESDGVSVTYPTSLLQLTDDEQHELGKIALARLHALQLPCIIVTPKRECSASSFIFSADSFLAISLLLLQSAVKTILKTTA